MLMEADAKAGDVVRVPHVVRGRTILSGEVEHRSRATRKTVLTPKLSLDELIWPRSEQGPAFDTPMKEIVDFLVEVGRALDLDRNPYLQEAAEQMTTFSTLSRRIIENCYRDLPFFFTRAGIEAEAINSFGSLDAIDGWRVRDVQGRKIAMRGYPTRLAHILAGNAPVVPPITIVRGALSKGVHLLKMPSNDMFTASAILRTMADVDPDHPTTKSFSAVYWRGGDESVESPIFRPQYFDKLIVWGGEAAVRHALKYVAPGFEIVSFDPKVSISLVGHEAFASRKSMEEAAARAAIDVVTFNQDACTSSRYQFVEGSVEEADAYCEALVAAMGADQRYGEGAGPTPPATVLDDVEMLGNLEPIYRVFGNADGRGMVVRSDEPVDFHPSGKLVNVVRVDKLADALRHVTIATQSVGVYPSARSAELRDALVSAGAQRIGPLGQISAGDAPFGGLPHDNLWPAHRFMRWVVDQNPVV